MEIDLRAILFKPMTFIFKEFILIDMSLDYNFALFNNIYTKYYSFILLPYATITHFYDIF